MEDVSFVIGIQTPWMQEMKMTNSYNSLIVMDSTFSTNKFGLSKTSIPIPMDHNLFIIDTSNL